MAALLFGLLFALCGVGVWLLPEPDPEPGEEPMALVVPVVLVLLALPVLLPLALDGSGVAGMLSAWILAAASLAVGHVLVREGTGWGRFVVAALAYAFAGWLALG